MDANVFWQQVNNSGLKIRASYTDPTKWVGVIRGKHIGPYDTREEVVTSAIRWLITQTEDANEKIEQFQEEKKRENAIEAIATFLRGVF